MLPAIRQRMRDREGFEVQDYGDFSRTRAGAAGGAPGGALGGGGFEARSAARGGTRGGDSTGRAARAGGGPGRGGPSLEQIIADSIPTSGWVFSTYEPFARYGTNYYGLRNRISILSEAFSHDPFARRVASTYDFVSEILSYVAEHTTEIIALGQAGRRQGRGVGDESGLVAAARAQVAHGHDAHRGRPRRGRGAAHRQHASASRAWACGSAPASSRWCACR